MDGRSTHRATRTVCASAVKYNSMKIISTSELHFPSINFGIKVGEPTELPENKEDADLVLSHPDISEYKEKTKAETSK